MQFFEHNVLITDTRAPEDILSSISGCGQWQIAVVIVGVVSHFFSRIDELAIKNSAPDSLDYACADGGLNGSRCLNTNGSKCDDFTFISPYNVTTLTEELQLVCENEHYTVWLQIIYRVGLLFGFFIVGVCGDKYGLKNTAMVFISLQSLTGILIISITNIEILVAFVLTHGLFGTGISLIPALAVCNVVGNKWRTLALGILSFPRATGFFIFPIFYSIFSYVTTLIGVTSILPLTLLIPLIYYKDSPNCIGLIIDFTKGEEVLRYIANFNKSPVSPRAKLRPVQVLIDSNVPQRVSFFQIWKPKKTRKVYLAITFVWFLNGFCTAELLHYAFKQFKKLQLFGFCATIGYAIAIILCHKAPHKIIIGISSFLRSTLIGGLFLYEFYWNDNTSHATVVLKMIASLFISISEAALYNITPRIFPTDLRGTCVGFCRSSFQMGTLLATVLRYNTNENIWIIGLFLLITSVFETLACFSLWNVHNRELPDYLFDCENFHRYYKPTRYCLIYDEAAHNEVQVKIVHLNKPFRTHGSKRNRSV